MTRRFALAYGVLVYVFFFATFLWAVGFVGNLGPWKTIDSGVAGPQPRAILVDLILMAIFALQHSLMARPAFKRLWTRVINPSVERSTYVLAATMALALLLWQWQPILTPVWRVTSGGAAAAVWVAFWTGWAILLLSTFLLNHLELFGLAQVFSHMRSVEGVPAAFRTPLLYKLVRHPLYLGFVIAFWAAPVMTSGHLLFSVATTAYICLGIVLEERDLIATFGDQYRSYRQRVPMLIPWPKRRIRSDGKDSLGY